MTSSVTTLLLMVTQIKCSKTGTMTDMTSIMRFKKIIQSLTYMFRLKADTDICDSKQNEYGRQYLCSQGRTQTVSETEVLREISDSRKDNNRRRKKLIQRVSS